MTSADPKGAYGGPSAVPGLIEAEEFDYGGEGVAYSDSSAINVMGVGSNLGSCLEYSQ